MDKNERIAEIGREIKRLEEERKSLTTEPMRLNARIAAIRCGEWSISASVGEKISYIARSAVSNQKPNGYGSIQKLPPYEKMTYKQQEAVRQFADTVVDLYAEYFHKNLWMEEDENENNHMV